MRWNHAMALVALVLVSTMVSGGENSEMSAKNQKKWKYPEARKVDVVDDYHGTKVADPYRWLEDPDAEETVAWVDKQNRLTRSYIEQYPAREKIESRLRDLWDYPKFGVPEKHGNRYFFTMNEGLQNQSVLYMMDSLKGKPKVLLDPNKLSEDGTVALRNTSFSEDGKLMAYALSGSGSDWQEIKIRNVENGRDYDDLIQWAKFAGIAWKHDHSGFFYNRFPTPGTVPKEDQNNFSRIYWHRLGTPQSEDRLVYEDPQNKELGFFPFITEDGKYLGLYVYHGTDDRNGFYYREVESDGEFVRLLEVERARFSPVGNQGTTFFFNTDWKAPRGRILAIDLARPDEKNWKEIVPEQEDVISSVDMVNDHLVVQYMHNAHELMKVHDTKGKFVRDIPMPTIGSIGGVSGRQKGSEMFFLFTSFLYPTSIYRYDFTTDKVELFRSSEIAFDPSGYETRQVFFTSKDGTRVPMFLTHRKGLPMNGDNPVLLYGYGGFNINMSPFFSVSRLVWIENGGVFAVANLRGGNEFGEEWHQEGMLDRKQNVFDDFIAAGEWLIRNKYTRKEKLAINGGSNGGLLVTACLIQRPDLFGAVVAQVPVTDMLRYHQWTVGRYWVPEYGNAEENPEDFKFLYAYSPLHNLEEGVAYPPTLVTTADTDDRVVPAHGKKFVATLQAADLGKNPILLRVETKAGHGAGKPTSKIIEEQSDIYAFLFQTLGIHPDPEVHSSK